MDFCFSGGGVEKRKLWHIVFDILKKQREYVINASVKTHAPQYNITFLVHVKFGLVAAKHTKLAWINQLKCCKQLTRFGKIAKTEIEAQKCQNLL